MASNSERLTGLAFLPIVATFGVYCLTPKWQSSIPLQFLPQISAFLALGFWVASNTNRLAKLGLELHKITAGLKWGSATGIFLGCLNSSVIIYLIPTLGGDITFLRNTPHAQLPFWVMMPWFILVIAFAVELNFRGFQLGRLLTWFLNMEHDQSQVTPQSQKFWIGLPLLLSAFTFSFDPFMVSTFGSLHWIALWDGLLWGWLWIRQTNLYAVFIAHAVEVMILYLTVRATLL